MSSEPEALEVRREAIINAHIDAENRFDVDGVLESMAEHNYSIVPYDVEISGRAAVREFMLGHFQAMPTITSSATRFYHCDDAVIVEVEFCHGVLPQLSQSMSLKPRLM